MQYPPYVQNPSLGGGSFDYTKYGAPQSKYTQQTGYNAGASIQDLIAGLKKSGMNFGGGADFATQLQGSDPYKQLMSKAGQSWGEYSGPLMAELENDYNPVISAAKGVFDSKNPSGAPVVSAQQLMAAGMRPVEAGARSSAQNLRSAGAAGGNRSGIGALASVLPGMQIAQQAGNVATQASIGAAQSEQQRAAMNGNMKMGALNTWSGAAGSKASTMAGAFQGYSSMQQQSLQAAMAALMAALGMNQANQPKLGMQGGPGGTSWNLSTPLGAAA